MIETLDYMTRSKDCYMTELALLERERQPRIVCRDIAKRIALKAKISYINEVLNYNFEPDECQNQPVYRVELVDFIDAHTEHEAIDIFIKAIPDIDLADEAFDVYEVDPLTRKAVKNV